jgi:probable F420-dependent oxidoreductase
MHYSVTMVATDRGLGIADVARAVEERGLDGLWVPDHTHIPVARQTPYPLGGELPERYRRNLDPLVALAMAAAVTTRIRVGTGVLLAAQRDPIVTAKALATIDHQSGGRLAAGIGYGWNLEEMRGHGVDPATRRARVREHVLGMRRLWEDEVASFQGEHVTFAPSWSWPKPVQRPLPVLVGGAANATVFAHIAEFGQGWVPTGGRALADGVARLRERVAEAGRDPRDLEVIPFVTAAQADHRRIDALERAGATEIAFDIQPADGQSVRGELDRLAGLIGPRRALLPPRPVCHGTRRAERPNLTTGDSAVVVSQVDEGRES